jgi:hypothetical protein
MFGDYRRQVIAWIFLKEIGLRYSVNSAVFLWRRYSKPPARSSARSASMLVIRNQLVKDAW